LFACDSNIFTDECIYKAIYVSIDNFIRKPMHIVTMMSQKEGAQRVSKIYPSDKESKHATVRLPKEMKDAIEDYLKTEDARRKGFLHVTDVVTAAVRDLLEEYGFYSPLEERKEVIKGS